jgi:trans-2,3-dihydro-3-hydroxyanthranilate isomerase
MNNRKRRFVIWDVFTQTPFSGNQLAILPEADGLTDSEMQRIARETNFSETVFLFPTAGPDELSRIRARIFTPERELPFAGHPVLGTALFCYSVKPSPAITIELMSGPVRVTIDPSGGGRVFGEMRQAEPVFRVSQIDPAQLAAGVGMPQADLDPHLPVQIISTGLPYFIVAVRDSRVLRNLRVDWSRATEFRARFEDNPSLYFVTRDCGQSDARLQARCLDPEREDPATGSAAGCAAAWMLSHGITGDDERVIVHQGAEVMRPSRIFVRASRSPNGPTNIRVGGYAIEVARGEYSWESDDTENTAAI